MSLGQATSFAPNAQKGTEAAARIKALLNSEPTIDSFSPHGHKPVSSLITDTLLGAFEY